MAVEGAVEVAQDLCFLCGEGVLADQAETSKADVDEVEEGGLVGGGGGRDDVARGGYGSEAVVAGEQQRVYGRGDGGDAGGLLERQRCRHRQHVVGGGVLQKGNVERGRLLYAVAVAVAAGFWPGGYSGRSRWR